MLVKHGDDVAEFVSDCELPQPVWNHGVEGVWAVGPVKVPRAGDDIWGRLLPRLRDVFDQVAQVHEGLACVRGFEVELGFLADHAIGFSEWQRLQMPASAFAGDIALLLPERSELLVRPPPSYP